MPFVRKPTVSKAWLLQAAAQARLHAEDSLASWILLGEQDRYASEMTRAHVLRRAAEIDHISARRAYLRRNGISA